MWIFTTIIHPNRIKMGLSMNEYCVLDVIYQSQTNPDFSNAGWAVNGNQEIGDFFGFSRQTVSAITNKMASEGFLEIGKKGKKKTTQKWYRQAYRSVKNLDSSNDSKCKESLQLSVKNLDSSSVKNLDSSIYKEEDNKEEKGKVSPALSSFDENAFNAIVKYIHKRYGDKKLLHMLDGIDIPLPEFREKVARVWVGKCRTFDPKNRKDQKGVEGSVERWIENYKSKPKETADDRLKEKIDEFFKLFKSTFPSRLISEPQKDRLSPQVAGLFKKGESLNSISDNLQKLKTKGACWRDIEFTIKNYQELKTYDRAEAIPA